MKDYDICPHFIRELESCRAAEPAEVDLVAPVGMKLKAGLMEALALRDTTKTITLRMTPSQSQICMNIINASTFEAKYAELVYGIKRKLELLIPPTPANQE